MYKVFLADDEIVVREGVRQNINWEDTPYVFSGEAADGEMALAMMLDIKPDILITDIRMPFMDGLELSAAVKRALPWVKIIILSGHDEFDYAKKAISIGVEEYMLKPIDAEELLEALGKVAERIEAEKLEKLSRAERGEQDGAAFSNKFVLDLALGSADAKDIAAVRESFGVELNAEAFLVCVGDIAPFGDTSSRIAEVRANVSPVIENAESGIYAAFGTDRLVLLLTGAADSLEESAYQLAQAVKHEVESNTDCKMTIGIGSIVLSHQQIAHSYSDAVTAARHLGVLGAGRIIGIKDITDIFALAQPGQQELFSPLSEKLAYAAEDGIDDIIDDYISSMDVSSLRSVLMFFYMLMDILMTSSRMVQQLGGDPAAVFPESLVPAALSQSASSPEQFREKARELLLRAISFRDSVRPGRYASTISKANEYINANFSDQDISLHTVASYVSLSPNHFSTVFSQETGMTFIEYLTSVRISNAKRLLKTTNMLSSEITSAVGYNDPHYFSYIFKKHVGMSPRDFRTSGT